MASAVSGVAGDGFRTTLHPAARAGAILRVTIVAGKFQGVTAATDGLAQHPGALAGVRRRHPLAGDAPGLLGKPPEVRDRASSNGLPFSVVMRRARTSRRFSINDWMFSSA